MAAQWYEEQLKNRNYLVPLGFQLNLEIFRGVDFLCQSVNLPDISMPITEVPTRFRSFPIVPGGGVNFGDLVINFIIDEDLINYKSIHNWILENGGANDHSTPDDGPRYSSAQLMILTSNFNVNHIIDFENIFPYSLTELSFDATDTQGEYFTAQASFKFTNYTIRDKNFKL